MSDVLSSEQRSYCMSRIKGKDTSPELALRKTLWSKGFRYRLKGSLIGKPDMIFTKYRIAVFVDGCFWHGCPKHYHPPKKNKDFWVKKIQSNIKRDLTVTRKLQSDGWLVLRFWEHDIKSDLEGCASKVIESINRCKKLKS